MLSTTLTSGIQNLFDRRVATKLVFLFLLIFFVKVVCFYFFNFPLKLCLITVFNSFCFLNRFY